MGHSVVVLEKKQLDELGHDWWDTMDSDIFARVGIPFPEPPELVSQYNMKLIFPDGTEGPQTNMPYTHLNVERKPLAARLIKYAKDAGAEFIECASVTEPLFDGSAVAGVRYELDGKEHELRACICVDASGISGIVRSKMPEIYGFEARVKREDSVVTYRELRKDLYENARSIFIIGVENGAQWVCRDNPGQVDFFACAMDNPGRRDPKEMVEGLKEMEGGAGELARGGVYNRIPVRRSFDSFVAPGLMLVGDCACMPNPMNGSGISSGLLGAKLAAETAHHALVRGDFSIASLWSYNAAYKRDQDVRFGKLHLLQRYGLLEDRENFYKLFKLGFVSNNSFWNMDKEFDFFKGLLKFPKLLPLLGMPAYLSRLARVFTLVKLVDAHYARYPLEYDPGRFGAWRDRLAKLFDSIPAAPQA